MPLKRLTLATTAIALSASMAFAGTETVSDDVIAQQRAALALASKDQGYGPQSPRDLTTFDGNNPKVFRSAPPYQQMNLCNIHFHEGAEHRGGEYTTYAGNGDGKGHGTGFVYNGKLTEAELASYEGPVGDDKYGTLMPGATIELHYVHTTAKIEPGPTLGSCLSEATMNPQLRVEGQVYVLVNDDSAADFTELTSVGMVNGFHQALNIPADTGLPITYEGSTTGPSYNEKASPLQVSWSMRPGVKKVSISSVAKWLEGNMFDESYAHGVRNLVVNPDLLSKIN